jgi:flagellar biosynthesis protein FliQ
MASIINGAEMSYSPHYIKYLVIFKLIGSYMIHEDYDFFATLTLQIQISI